MPVCWNWQFRAKRIRWMKKRRHEKRSARADERKLNMRVFAQGVRSLGCRGRFPCILVISLYDNIYNMPVCWNWQTRWTQNPFPATGCGFKSRHRHQDSQNKPFGLVWEFFCFRCGTPKSAVLLCKMPISGQKCGTILCFFPKSTKNSKKLHIVFKIY